MKLLSADNDEITIRRLFTIGDGHPTQPNFVSSNIAADSLDGVWELAMPPEVAARRPEDQRVRLVFVGDWFATVRGSQQISASRFTIEPQHTPKQISFVDKITIGEVEGRSMRGIYEVKEDGLRLSLAITSLALPQSSAPNVRNSNA